MTGQQVAHMENAITRFTRAYREKQRIGQLEHGGFLAEKPNMLGHALEEVLDLVAYLDTLDGQIDRLAEALEAGAISGPDAAAILRTMGAKDWR